MGKMVIVLSILIVIKLQNWATEDTQLIDSYYYLGRKRLQFLKLIACNPGILFIVYTLEYLLILVY